MKENNFQIIGGATTEDAIRSAVTVFSRKIDEILAKKERAVVGGAAGRMLESFYHALRHEPIAWHKVDLFMLDERLVPFDHPASNARMIFETLVQPLISDGRFQPSQWHPFDGGDPALQERLRGYNATLKQVGGTFDIALLAIGDDGHLASLFPSHPSIENQDTGYIAVSDAPKPPPRRISASRSLLLGSQSSLVFFWGETKLDAFARFRDPAINLAQCPAKILYRMKNVSLVTPFMLIC